VNTGRIILCMARRDGTTLSLLFDLFVASQRVRSLLATAMADSGLTPDEYAVYSALFDLGPMSPTELGRAVGMPPTTVSHYVRALRERGHAGEQPNPADNRSYLLRLSASGRVAHRRASAAFEEAFRRFAARLDDAESASRAVDAIQRAAEEALTQLLHDARSRAG